MDAVEESFRRIAERPDVRLVPCRKLFAWLEAQDPAVLARLADPSAGHLPPNGWQKFLPA